MAVILMSLCLAAQVAGSPIPQDTPRSADVAKRLVSALTARQLDAIAVEDPEEPGRFIAALAFPDVQLLVVSAPSKSAAYLKLQLTKRQFRDVYVALQEGDPAGRLFFHDMGGNGVDRAGESIDVFYEGKDQKTLFDGKWEGQSLTEQEYASRWSNADERYTRMLTVLLDAVKQIPITTDPN